MSMSIQPAPGNILGKVIQRDGPSVTLHLDIDMSRPQKALTEALSQLQPLMGATQDTMLILEVVESAVEKIDKGIVVGIKAGDGLSVRLEDQSFVVFKPRDIRCGLQDDDKTDNGDGDGDGDAEPAAAH